MSKAPKSHKGTSLMADPDILAALADINATIMAGNTKLDAIGAAVATTNEKLDGIMDVLGIIASGCNSGGGGYHAGGVHFDGGGLDGVLRASAPDGVVNGSVGSLSYWRKSSSTENSFIQNANTGSWVLGHKATPELYIDNQVTGDGNSWVLATFDHNFNDGTWQNIKISWNVGFAAGSRIVQCYVGDTPIAIDTSDENGGAFTINYEDSWWVPLPEGGAGGECDVADLAVYLGTFIDFSIEANRRKFIDANGKPVDPGNFPANPTFLFSAPDFSTNRGTGGETEANGDLTNASTSPSD